MKQQEKYQKFADELKELCEKHWIAVISTCESEGILGEILFVDMEEDYSNEMLAVTYNVTQSPISKRFVLNSSQTYDSFSNNVKSCD